MRNTLLLLFVIVFQVHADETYSQNTKLSLSLNNVTLASALEEIQNSSEFYFLFNAKLIDVEKNVSISVKDEKISEILTSLFSGTGVNWVVYDRQIILTPSDIKALSEAMQQQQKITGTVTEKDGTPLPGVNVVVSETTQGVTTDIAGKYSIEVPPGSESLIFSFIGMEPQKITIGALTQINVIMVESATSLDEVVVIGYGTMKKRDVTGAISSISAQKISESPAIQNVQQALQGRVAGVDVFGGSNRPGDAPTVRIRGRRSFQATNDPLYIIDGIPSASNINEINPYDIESIEVLKDASATAIYGSRGANGVILITTKRGKSGKTKVTFNAQYGFQEPMKMLEMMDGPEYLEMCREALRNMGQYAYGDPTLAQDKNTWPYKKNDAFVVKNIENAYDANGVYHPELIQSYDWMNSFINTKSTLEQYQLNISGGTENTQASLNVGYQNDKGLVEGQNYKNYSAKLTFDQSIGKRIKAGGALTFGHYLQNRGYSAMDLSDNMSPLAIPWDENGNLILRPGNDDTYTNPHFNMNGGIIDERKSDRVMGSFYGDFKITEAIKYRLNIGIDYRPFRNGEFSSAYSTDNHGGFANATYSGGQSSGYTIENLLYYNKIIGIHNIGVTLLQSVESSVSESYSASGSQYPSEHYTFYNIGGGELQGKESSGFSAWQMASFMGRINYVLKDKYLLTASLRYDGASRLSPGNKWGTFPSFALAWKINQEDFLANIKSLSELKLRVGYGVTGQSGVNPYGTQGVLSRVVYSFGKVGTTGFKLNTMPNPGLSWEQTAQSNVGLDFGFLHQRVTGTVNGYIANTTQLLMNRQLSSVTGYSSVTQNIGATKNTGIEFSLSGMIVQKKDFSWSAEIMLYSNKEEIVSLYGGKSDDVGNNWFIGQPIGTYFDYKFAGIWQTEDAELMALYKANGDNSAKPGYIRRYDKPDENGNIDYKITTDDRVILGSDAPDWTGSLSTRVAYKNFDFSAYLNTRQGQMISSNIYTSGATLFGRYNCIKLDYWTPTNPSNTFPQPYASQENPLNSNVLKYRDGSFTRLKTVSLGYVLPENLTNKMNMANLRVSFSINNVYLWSSFDGFDVETNTGFDSPTPRSYVFGIDASF